MKQTNEQRLLKALEGILTELRDYEFIGTAGTPENDIDHHWSHSPSIMEAQNAIASVQRSAQRASAIGTSPANRPNTSA